MLSLTILRPLGMRIGTHLFEAGLVSDEDTYGTIIAVALTVIAGIIILIINRKLLKEERSISLKTPAFFARKAAVIYFILTGIVYFFTDDSLPFEGIKSISDFCEQWNGGHLTVLLLSLTAFVLFFVFFILSVKSYDKYTKIEVKEFE